MKSGRQRSILIFFMLMLIFISWSPASALDRREEEKLGREIVRQVRVLYGFYNDPDVVLYVRHLGERVVSDIENSLYTYRFYVVNQDIPNAFTVPGGHVFINKGLLGILEDEGELASILTHEIAHAQARHIHRQIEMQTTLAIATLATGIVGAILGGNPGLSQTIAVGGAAGSQTMALAYSRDHEREADQIGMRYLIEAGYNPENAVDAMRRLAARTWGGRPGVADYLMTHPGLYERIDYLQTIKATITTNKNKKKNEQDVFPFVKVAVYARSGERNSLKSTIAQWKEGGRDSCLIQYAQGMYDLSSGEYANAVQNLRKAQSECGNNLFVATGLADAYFRSGNLAGAYNVLAKALIFDSTYYPVLHYRLGVVAQEQGLYQKALEHFRAIPEEDKDLFLDLDYRFGIVLGKMGFIGEAHEALGDYYKKQGDLQLARFHYEKALENVNEAERKKTIQKKIQRLKSS